MSYTVKRSDKNGNIFYSHYYKKRYSLNTFLPLSFSSLYFFVHRQTPRENSVTQKMSTLIVPATIPSVSEDCEQLRKAFEGLPHLTFSTSFARVCVCVFYNSNPFLYDPNCLRI